MLRREWYEDTRCPKCGSLMLDGRCENKECDYHWRRADPDELRLDEEEEYRQIGA